MLKLSILEFFLISIPESFIFIMGIYFLSKRFFTKKSLIIMALLFAMELIVLECYLYILGFI